MRARALDACKARRESSARRRLAVPMDAISALIGPGPDGHELLCSARHAQRKPAQLTIASADIDAAAVGARD